MLYFVAPTILIAAGFAVLLWSNWHHKKDERMERQRRRKAQSIMHTPGMPSDKRKRGTTK